MVERRLIVKDAEVSFSGFFKPDEVYAQVDKFIADKGYQKHEKNNYEYDYPEGKEMFVEKEPYKKITFYAKYVLNIKIMMSRVREVTVEVSKGKKEGMYRGDVKVVINGYLETDYEHRWDKPFFFLLRHLFDHHIYKHHTEEFEAGLKEEVEHLREILKTYFNIRH